MKDPNSKAAVGPVFRMMDASLNRAGEGIRVLEDIARMVLNDASLTAELKNLRHDIEEVPRALKLQLVSNRNASGDIGAGLTAEAPFTIKDISSTVIANARRAEQALRTLEELTRLPLAVCSGEVFQKARFRLYSIEKDLLGRLSRRQTGLRIKGLYVILDSHSLGGRPHIDLAIELIRAGVKIIQLREKDMPSRQFLDIACRLKSICSEAGALLIVNDKLDIALAAGADGLHLGQDDLPVAVARQHLPFDRLIGVSVETVEQAREAEMQGADYIAAQALFPTASKECAPIGIEAFKSIRAATAMPLVAIGGINIDNIDQVISAGADSAAVIRGVTLNPDPCNVCRQMITRFETFSP
ncbi:MAG: thiamine phosphate synthase [Dehalococcoidaceae bacterium]|nr:thiamine phosphate synthase [Dehalococcoidaceae bacterium]